MASTVAENILALENKTKLKEFQKADKEVAFVAIGKNDGAGYLPFMPNFVVDFMVRKLKSPDLFVSRAAGFYNHKVQPKK
jgi:NADH dehydrogenase FAD-containing subunit